MVYTALAIPILAAIAMLIFFNRKVVWWELGLPILASLIAIWGAKKGMEYGLSLDTDFHGSFITEARYYEYWETYVHKTCSRTVSCGKNCTTTQYYDCSYCDENAAYWEVIDNYGNSWNVSEGEYNRLVSQWKATPVFFDMHRNINHSFSCGKDGNMYYVKWNGEFETSEPAVTTHEYENKVKVSRSTFHYRDISDGDAAVIGLYQYPKIYSRYRQDCILGIDSIYSTGADYIRHLYQYFNAYAGVNYHAKVFVLLFYGKSQSIALDQEAYWEGGNDNEITICIDLDKSTYRLNWVKCFTWCDNKRVGIEIRENLMNQRYFNYQTTIQSLDSAIKQYYKPKNFNDFDYLDVELPIWSIIFIYLITIAVTAATSYWAITNDYQYNK